MSVLLIVVIVETVALLTMAFKMRRPHYDGAMVVMETDDKKSFSLVINGDPNELDQKRAIVLKVTEASD